VFVEAVGFNPAEQMGLIAELVEKHRSALVVLDSLRGLATRWRFWVSSPAVCETVQKPRSATLYAMTRVALILAVLTFSASPAVAAPAPSGAPVRFWSVSKVEQGAGDVEITGGAQFGDMLHKLVDIGPSVFNFGPSRLFPDPRPYNSPVDGRASGEVFSSADGRHYSVAAQAPALNPFRVNSPKGAVTHLDTYQAYQKRAGDASLKITLTDAFVEAVDSNLERDPLDCVRHGRCFPVRSIVRFHARAYAASAGGDFFNVGGIAFVKGRSGTWDHWDATSSDSQAPLWAPDSFLNTFLLTGPFGGEPYVGITMRLAPPRTLKVPLASVRTGEVFGVHVSLEAEAVSDRGRESGALAYIRDPQDGAGLLRPHGLTPRGKPKFKEPRAGLPKPARCPGGAPRKAGAIGLSEPDFTASESDHDPLVLVTRTGGAHGSASVTLDTRGGTARSGADYRRTSTTVRFGDGDSAPRLVEIPLREDREAEPAETFTVGLAHARCAELAAARSAAVTILDDDMPATPPQDPAPPPPANTPQPTPTPAPAGLDHTFGADGRVSEPVGDGHGEAVVIQPDGGIVTVGRRGTPTGTDYALTRHNTAGTLDRSFGTGGIAATDLGGAGDEAYDAALTPDGGIVAVGRTDAAGFTKLDFGVVRYRPDGTPDTRFDGDGIVQTDVLGGGDQANAVVVQPDGKIVVGGYAAAGVSSDFALVRYNPDGTLDTSFDGDGIVTTDLGTASDDIRGLVLQPDGRIVAAGTAGEDVALARYLPDGRLDPAFGQAGTRITDFGSDDVANGVALTAGGEILIAGQTLGARVDRDFMLARYTAAGALDTAFGDHGIVKTDLGDGDDFAENLTVDGQGRIVVVGRATSPTILDMALVRYEPDGTLDTSFDGDGILTADFHGKGEFGQDVALDAAGRIVAAGYTATGTDVAFALMRANP
jgi:uncharacterized delta-60 repeat protein